MPLIDREHEREKRYLNLCDNLSEELSKAVVEETIFQNPRRDNFREEQPESMK